MEKAIELKAMGEFFDKFNKLMFELKLENKFRKTYHIEILKETNYGYFVHVYLSTGLSFEALKEKRIIIEQNLKCLWIMKTEPFQEYAEVQIVLRSVDKDLDYENPKIKPWEIYLGLNFAMKVLKNNLNDRCMVLLAGSTGTGKTRFIYLILLSWILGCSPSDVRLYISDIAKNEYSIFKNVNHVKWYASELDELCAMMKELQKIFQSRKKIISSYIEQGLATNIYGYNKLNKSKKLSYCYVLVDEFSVLIPDKTDSKTEKEQKEFILDVIKTLEKTGRSYGIFPIIATQKTTRDEIPSIIKNMSAVRLSFRANDGISSEVIMGDSSAMGLADRIAVYSTNGGSIQDYLFSPKIEIETVLKLLEPHLKNKQISSANQQKSKSNIIKGKVTTIPKSMAKDDSKKVIQLFSPSKKEDDYIDY